MNKTYIIGSGNLSNSLKKKIINSSVLTSKEFLNNISNINKNKKINLIINSFYSSGKLNNLTSYEFFVKKTNYEISKILDLLNSKIIDKIIYTSSSSIYSSINKNIANIADNNRDIYSAFKISSESLIKNFCNKNKIQLNICRVFNIYGQNDKFSILQKLKDIKKNKKKIKIANNGLSVRDFIHVDDVVKIYFHILKNISESDIYDVGTGKGVSIFEIISKLKLNKKYITYKNKKISEISQSIANTKTLIKKIPNIKFKKIENFLKVKEEIKYKTLSNDNFIENRITGSVIYGAGYSGIKIGKQILLLDKKNVSYYVDDDKKKIGTFINEKEVISFNHLKKISEKAIIENIIIAIPSLSKKKRSDIIKKVLKYSDSVSELPEKDYFKKKDVEISDINEVSFDEILNKKSLDLNFLTIKNLKNSRILVTGGAGSIGREISKQIIKFNPKELIILDHSELNIYKVSKFLKHPKLRLILGDIKDEKLINNIIDEYKVNYIFHTAAYKHVKFLEENINSAIKNNIIGTYNLLKAVNGKKIKFIFISTDKAVNPKTVLGITKRIGEILTQIIFSMKNYNNSNYYILRFGNVIGSDGSALPHFLNQIKKDLPISLTHKNMSRYFMSIQEACNLVIRSSASKYKNKILFLDMGKPVKILDVIKKIFKIYGKKNQRLKINISGNKFNEKLKEKLFIKNKIFKTSINKVFFIQDTLPDKEKFIKSLEKVIFNIDNLNKKRLSELLNKILKIK